LTFNKVEGIRTDLDPHLQSLVCKFQQGGLDASAVAGLSAGQEWMVDVLAVVRDPALPVPGLEVATAIGDVLTGQVRVQDVEMVRRDPNIISLKAARAVQPTLYRSVPEIRADGQTLQQLGLGEYDGTGVIVGIVDYGCDFAHQNFLKDDGESRVLFLWDQGGSTGPHSPDPYGYGREYTQSEINTALKTAKPYQTLGYRPGPGFQNSGMHGTHVMDIAAGNGRGTGYPGVAPKADIIFVQLDGGDYAPDQSFGNSRQLLEAVNYVFERADALGQPAVINLSLGTHGGPHDGTTPAERGFDNLLADRKDRAIVIAAGNSRAAGGHAMGTVPAQAKHVIQWERPQVDRGGDELEVWYGGGDVLEATLIAPQGQRVGPVKLGETYQASSAGKKLMIQHRAHDPLNGDNVIDIIFDPYFPGEDWQVELSAPAGSVDFHAWIERDDPDQSRISPGQVTTAYTINSIACGQHTIAVGSYKAFDHLQESFFSSAGPTRSGRQKPELSAPGHDVHAAKSETVSGITTMSGTSMAAPHITGATALLFQRAAASGLAITNLRDLLMKQCRLAPPPAAWNEVYGQGRVDCAASLLVIPPSVGNPAGLTPGPSQPGHPSGPDASAAPPEEA
jgi:subtilisin family serine protease